jgi:hypothetical protein
MKHVNDLYRRIYDLDCNVETGNHPTGLSFEEWLKIQPPIDINPEQINIQSWIKVTEKCKCWKNVSTSKWVESVNPDYLQSLNFEQWDEIAQLAGLSTGWAVNRWKENKV